MLIKLREQYLIRRIGVWRLTGAGTRVGVDADRVQELWSVHVYGFDQITQDLLVAVRRGDQPRAVGEGLRHAAVPAAALVAWKRRAAATLDAVRVGRSMTPSR